MNTLQLLFGVLFFFTIFQTQASATDSRFSPPGELEKDSGVGIKDSTVLFPNMRFPLENSPAYLNSQVYRKGGSKGPEGGQCDVQNYSFPWRDNFCEKRSYLSAFCSVGTGHQGQDIRPATCNARVHWAVAAEDGVIAQIGRFSVTLQSPSGTLYRYLHLDMKGLAVKELDMIRKGARIGKVSNDFDGTPTTIHLHFDIKDTILIKGKPTKVYLPPYTSLVESFKKLKDGQP